MSDVAYDEFDGPATEAGRADLDRNIAAMRRLLEAMRPISDAQALKTLRDRFPDTSLAARVAAVSGARMA